ncbi:MAG: hypothetical protein CVU42_00285 [Chloroflexi bacterium HGW-Chloroflexi-4]|jgi:ADP-ribose pyrophosphatase YjhB (NUDIX family)|nr:MAG: hypothetical protein CVU42_00285 [Chloroflexi bacterium HGW-Chloroflexi-4]
MIDKKYYFCPYCGTKIDFKISCDFCFFCKNNIYTGPPIACCTLLQTHSGIVLVLRKNGIMKNKWCLPGGFMQFGETPSTTASRETKEETGYSVEVLNSPFCTIFDTNQNPNNSTLCLVFYGRIIAKNKIITEEIYQSKIFSPNDIPWENLAFTSTEVALKMALINHSKDS